MRYYIEYPIPIACGLRCEYCFHSPLWEYNERYPHDRRGGKCAFTLAQFKAWMGKHLADAEEILVELQGGEMSHPDCQAAVLDVIDNMGGGARFQLQTNGLGDADFYLELIARRDKIDRIGFTFHRKELVKRVEQELDDSGDKSWAQAVCRFYQNVALMILGGVKVYVKELLFLDLKDAILASKKFWEECGVEFRIQDFKGAGGIDNTESYTANDWALVHPEYRHDDKCCHCREGYKQIIVRGYDQHGGDVLACWQDHKVIGNIVEDWYEPYDCVAIDTAMPRCRRVVGKGVYRGDYMYDVRLNALEKQYHKLYPKESKMLAKAEAEVQRLTEMLRQAEQTLAQHRQGVEQSTALVLKLQGALEVVGGLIASAKEEETKLAELAEKSDKAEGGEKHGKHKAHAEATAQ
ncbi:hypothetical protein R80B4_00976 [Fibrobacteres bacterium R8-0-B4]